MIVHRGLASLAIGSATAVLLVGCTSIQVQPLDRSLSPSLVCIQHNPKVQVADFVDVLQAGFERHRIPTQVFEGDLPASCEFVLTYTALRSWDLATYLSHAELYLDRNGERVASAEYHLRGKGGYSLMKYQGTEQKMTPVIDQLLAQY
ncbi:MAG: Sbal_3080 family lipoprotein [Proteobacteria bacterium]|nr:Sbal_3080 family lipoprotein [Pseudomonadota bacterium]